MKFVSYLWNKLVSFALRAAVLVGHPEKDISAAAPITRKCVDVHSAHESYRPGQRLPLQHTQKEVHRTGKTLNKHNDSTPRYCAFSSHNTDLSTKIHMNANGSFLTMPKF